MKKTVLALAVAAALAAPLAAQADTILYGSARVSVDYNDEKPGLLDKASGASDPDGYWDVINNDSLLGVMGSEELGGGLSAVYQYEFGVDVTEGGNFESDRPKFVGLKGGFGVLTLGTQESPYYHIAGITDIFNSGMTFTAPVWLGGSFNGFEIDVSENTSSGSGALTRYGNSVYYATPDFNGFSGEAMIVMNGADNSPAYSAGIDVWNIAIKYSNGPFFAGASYIQLDGDNSVPLSADLSVDLDLDQWIMGLGYATDDFSVNFIYEQGALNQFGLISNTRIEGIRVGGDDATNFYLTGSYTFGNNVISAAYGQLDPGATDEGRIDNYVFSYQHNLSKRTLVWAEYIGRNVDDNSFYGDQNAVSIGTKVDF
jgi:predicted porin